MNFLHLFYLVLCLITDVSSLCLQQVSVSHRGITVSSVFIMFHFLYCLVVETCHHLFFNTSIFNMSIFFFVVCCNSVLSCLVNGEFQFFIVLRKTG